MSKYILCLLSVLLISGCSYHKANLFYSKYKKSHPIQAKKYLSDLGTISKYPTLIKIKYSKYSKKGVNQLFGIYNEATLFNSQWLDSLFEQSNYMVKAYWYDQNTYQTYILYGLASKSGKVIYDPILNLNFINTIGQSKILEGSWHLELPWTVRAFNWKIAEADLLIDVYEKPDYPCQIEKIDTRTIVKYKPNLINNMESDFIIDGFWKERGDCLSEKEECIRIRILKKFSAGTSLSLKAFGIGASIPVGFTNTEDSSLYEMCMDSGGFGFKKEIYFKREY